LEQVEQDVKFKFSQPENSTLEQVAQAVKFKVLVQNLIFFKNNRFSQVKIGYFKKTLILY